MELGYLVRRLTYSAWIRTPIRLLRLQRVAQSLYYHSVVGRAKRTSLTIHGVKASFVVNSPARLRELETVCFVEGDLLNTWVSELRPGEVVYDIGSSMGLYAVFSALTIGENGQVCAFEPNSERFGELCQNAHVNRISNLITFQRALGADSKPTTMYLVDGCPSVLPGTGQRPCGTVEMVEGDRFVEESRLPLPNVVKIDVEGYEGHVLTGLQETLSRPGCRLLCCEIHPGYLPKGVTPESIQNTIRSFGFDSLEVRHRELVHHLIARKTQFSRISY